jgi:protein-L-isoaspartate(D-aspartate) O-methyltransferase
MKEKETPQNGKKISPAYQALLEQLKAEGVLRTSSIISAFEAIDRRDFVPPALVDNAYVNAPLPIGQGQTISQPLTVAFMLELLSPQAGQKILDVGSGSGWTTALLAYIVGERGKVIGLEVIPELCEMGERNVAKYNFIASKRVKIYCRNARAGFPEEAPYDRILAGAAGEQVPQAWKDQLKVGGRIVAPVESSVVLIERKGVGQWEEREYPGFSFVPLV